MNRKEELANELWNNVRIRNDKDLHTLLSELGRKPDPFKDKASELAGYFLTDGRPLIRHSALVSLMELEKIDDHIEQVIQMLDDDYPMVREAATVAVGRTSIDTEQMLIELLKSPFTEVRFQAPISLVEKNYLNSADELLKRLDEEGDQEIKTNLLIALGDFRYTPAINKVLEIHNNHPYEIIRFEAAYTAARLGDTSCVDFLANFVSHDVYGENAVTALETLSDSLLNQEKLLLDLKKHYNKLFLSTERRISISSLMIRLGDYSSFNWLKQRVKSFLFQTRMQAINRLGHTSYTESAIFLFSYIDNLTEKKQQERETAAKALVTLCYDLLNKGTEISSFLNNLTALSQSENLDPETIKEIRDFLSENS